MTNPSYGRWQKRPRNTWRGGGATGFESANRRRQKHYGGQERWGQKYEELASEWGQTNEAVKSLRGQITIGFWITYEKWRCKIFQQKQRGFTEEDWQEYLVAGKLTEAKSLIWMLRQVRPSEQCPGYKHTNANENNARMGFSPLVALRFSREKY